VRLEPKPTVRQQEVLDWMVSFCLTHHSPPTYADIAKGFGLPHHNGMVSTVRSLRRKGLVDQYTLRPECLHYAVKPEALVKT
jgi:SOS-response transcriptional repressor LexA